MQRMTRVCWNTVTRYSTTAVSAVNSIAVSFKQYLSCLHAATFCCLNTEISQIILLLLFFKACKHKAAGRSYVYLFYFIIIILLLLLLFFLLLLSLWLMVCYVDVCIQLTTRRHIH